MNILNGGRLKEYRGGPCEWCYRSPGNPHHIRARGMGRGSCRLDIAANLICLCAACHRSAHDGHILREDCEAIVARRLGCLQTDIRKIVDLLVRLPKEIRDDDVNRLVSLEVGRELIWR